MIDDFKPDQRPVQPAPKLDNMLGSAEDKNPIAEPAFEAPETVAAHEAASAEPPEMLAASQIKKRPSFLKFKWPPTKKEWLTIAAAVVLLGAGITSFILLHKTYPVTPVKITKHKKVVAAPTTVPSNLTGLPVDPSINQRPVTGVMIENSTFARPQSALGQAGVVFEAIAEGGITRFLALYLDYNPEYVGPVRSVRPYYLQWDLGFDAPIAHVGGSPEALQDIKDWGVKDLDQFSHSGYYQRISSREAPHNVYTSIVKLNELEHAKGYGTSNFSGFARKAEAPVKLPTAKTIYMNISSPDYNVQYNYDYTSNSYKRFVGGAAHIDGNTGGQLSPKVVIALVIPYNLQSDNKHSQYGIVGNGQAYIFQDGSVTVGGWSKSASNAQIVFVDSNNQPVKLNAGQTWLTAVSSGDKVSYKP
ncbi:MAG TPA: DUF3048 domain-containing protein [Candidatus Saccharimonadales bacterium]|nr:DUF3048 domain-containing protein [Candidatus Saccharimonadales bacterium]